MRTRIFLYLLLSFAFALPVHASIMDMVSDLITTSAPGAPADHRIRFTTTHAVPPGGTITIALQEGAFTIPLEFDYTNVDFRVWDGTDYVDRDINTNPSATEDGVVVTPGTSGTIIVTLSSTQGLPADSKVEFLLGRNASYADPSEVSIINPVTQASYRIPLETKDDLGASIDYASAMIAVVNPVTLLVPLKNVAPVVMDSLPTGVLAPNSKIIELTFSTDRTATCRYSTTPNTPYLSMTNSFAPAKTTVFYKVIGGHANGTSYTYYVRCIGIQGAVSTTDYPLTFSLAATPISNTSVTQQGSQIGSGSIPNGSEVLFQSTATLAGLTAPGSTVRILKDGVVALSIQAGPDGKFHADVGGLERGSYTFSMYSLDVQGRKSASFASTLTVGAGTNNTISNIILPPTLELPSDQFGINDIVKMSGSAVVNSGIDVSIIPAAGTAGDTQHVFATTTNAGTWDAQSSSTLKKGTYLIKARQVLPTAQSDFSIPLYIGIGQSPALTNKGARADINGDGKVNLIDFSILLTSWNKSDTASDLNSDGTVNLADFSILLFNWTG